MPQRLQFRGSRFCFHSAHRSRTQSAPTSPSTNKKLTTRDSCTCTPCSSSALLVARQTPSTAMLCAIHGHDRIVCIHYTLLVHTALGSAKDCWLYRLCRLPLLCSAMPPTHDSPPFIVQMIFCPIQRVPVSVGEVDVQICKGILSSVPWRTSEEHSCTLVGFLSRALYHFLNLQLLFWYKCFCINSLPYNHLISLMHSSGLTIFSWW